MRLDAASDDPTASNTPSHQLQGGCKSPSTSPSLALAIFYWSRDTPVQRQNKTTVAPYRETVCTLTCTWKSNHFRWTRGKKRLASTFSTAAALRSTAWASSLVPTTKVRSTRSTRCRSGRLGGGGSTTESVSANHLPQNPACVEVAAGKRARGCRSMPCQVCADIDGHIQTIADTSG